MVFIYGGAFVTGASAEILYGPELLLQKDVVIVTLNYRLGVLGKQQIVIAVNPHKS